jgi:hypothetical protein
VSGPKYYEERGPIWNWTPTREEIVELLTARSNEMKDPEDRLSITIKAHYEAMSLVTAEYQIIIDELRSLLSSLIGHSNCYCDTCQAIAKKYHLRAAKDEREE